MVNQARDLFMSLDAEVRKRFGNDPAQLLDFLADNKNYDEAKKLGLVDVKAPPKVDESLETLKSIDKSLKGSKKRSSDLQDTGSEAE